jgi:hypothetical protein
LLCLQQLLLCLSFLQQLLPQQAWVTSVLPGGHGPPAGPAAAGRSCPLCLLLLLLLLLLLVLLLLQMLLQFGLLARWKPPAQSLPLPAARVKMCAQLLWQQLAQ